MVLDEEAEPSAAEVLPEVASSSWEVPAHHNPPTVWQGEVKVALEEQLCQSPCLAPFHLPEVGCANAHSWICGPLESSLEFWTGLDSLLDDLDNDPIQSDSMPSLTNRSAVDCRERARTCGRSQPATADDTFGKRLPSACEAVDSLHISMEPSLPSLRLSRRENVDLSSGGA